MVQRVEVSLDTMCIWLHEHDWHDNSSISPDIFFQPIYHMYLCFS